MADYIDRQAAIDALNKLDVSDGVGISSVACNLQEEAIRSIENLPSAQPDIIRCKDCKYRDADDFCTGRGYPNVLVPDDGFCDKGERRTDG